MLTAPRAHEVGTGIIKIKQTHHKNVKGCHKSRILHKDFEKKSLYDSFSGEDGSGFATIAKLQRLWAMSVEGLSSVLRT